MQSGIFTFFLPLTLAVLMMGLGLLLSPKDFIRVNQQPKVIFIALFTRQVLLVGLAFILCLFLDLPPLLAVGLMLLSATPSGSTSALFSYVYKGDVALNIVVVAINSVMAILTLPFIISIAMRYFMADQTEINMPIERIAYTFLLILVPVCLGMAIRSSFPELAKRLSKPIRRMSVYFIFALFFFALFQERYQLAQYMEQVGLATALYAFVSLVAGYVLPQLMDIPEQQARSCGFFMSIHNTALSLTLALSVLQSTQIAIPAAIYTIFMYMFALIFGHLLARRMPLNSVKQKVIE